MERIPWSEGKSPISRHLIAVLATWSRLPAVGHGGQALRGSWTTVVGAVDAAVDHGLARRDLSRLRYLGIDEISRRRRHVYDTNVYDFETKALIWSEEGRSDKTLHAFFDAIGPAPDGSDRGHLLRHVGQLRRGRKAARSPGGALFDKFHLVRHLLNAVNDVHKMEQKALREADPALLKDTRFIWLKNPENLTDRQATASSSSSEPSV